MSERDDPWVTTEIAPPLPWEDWLGRAEPWMWVLVVIQALCMVATLLGIASLVRHLPYLTAPLVAWRVGLPVLLLAIPTAVNGVLSLARSRLAWRLAEPHVPRLEGRVQMLRAGPLLWISMAILMLPGSLALGAAGGWLPSSLLGWTPAVTLLLGGVVMPLGVFGWDGALARILPEADHADRLAFEARWAGVVSWSAHTMWLVGAGRLEEAGRVLALFHRRGRLFVPGFLVPLGAWSLADGRPRAAVAVFDAARQLSPGDPRALAGWAEARLVLGHADSAVLEALELAREGAQSWRWRWNRPGWTTVLDAQRAWALAQAGRTDGARLAVEALRPTVSGLHRLPRGEAESALVRAEALIG